MKSKICTFDVEADGRRRHDDDQWLSAKKGERQSANRLPDDCLANIYMRNMEHIYIVRIDAWMYVLCYDGDVCCVPN